MIDANSNIPELSVSELAGSVKRMVEDRFGFVRVRGEISGLKIAASGHVYLALKDDVAVLDGVMWKGTASSLRFRPEDGLDVICTGKITTYPGRSKYQIVIERMEVAGVGALMALLEQRKKLLAAEGLFEAARKKPIPFLPRTIGIVTSPTGAVIQDILHRLADRFPTHVQLWPVLVQGDKAAAQVAAAIAGFNAMEQKPDVLIIARGGGSIEDLWAFNEEVVARAVAASNIPIISAIGHETDTTLIDYVSDRRAPTPTAAAEMAVPVRADLRDTVQDIDLRLHRAARRLCETRYDQLRSAVRALPAPRDLLGLPQQRFDEASGRLPRSLRSSAHIWQAKRDKVTAKLSIQLLQRRAENGHAQLLRTSHALRQVIQQISQQATQSLHHNTRLMNSLNPYNILKRGYAVVRARNKDVITTAQMAQKARDLVIDFHDGSIDVSTMPSDKLLQGRLF
jgi:exodeoxyribonuclease VII large subunit